MEPSFIFTSFANFTVIVAGLPSFASVDTTPMLSSVNALVDPPLIANVSPKPTVTFVPVSPTNTRPRAKVSVTSFTWPCVATTPRSASVTTLAGSHFVFVKPDTVPFLISTLDVVPSGFLVVTAIPSAVTVVLVPVESPN